VSEHADKPSPPLRLESVTKRFRQGTTTIEALRGVSLTVERGELVAVMGASGSGKSTLLHIAAGLTRPDSGRVLVEGEDLSAMPDRQLTRFRRRRIGLVFQAFNLISALTIEENVLLPVLADDYPDEGRGRLDELLEQFELADRRRHRPERLSGGQQQRVAIARALIANPAVILADEPTGSLDSVSGQKLCRNLRNLSRVYGRTILVVTHEPVVAAWATRVVVLRDGQVLTEFDTADFHDAQGLATRYQDVVGAAEVPET
jgi:putative ABC transport system ATP-binding protein